MDTIPSSEAETAFAPGDQVVYPSHGVGRIKNIETQSIGDQQIQVFVISFEHDGLVVRVPLMKAKASGLRRLSTPTAMEKALETLSQPAGQKKGMWNRRASEYTAKIKTGDPVSLAEVVRDLYRAPAQSEGSYSERRLYEQALGRLSHEIAAVDQTKLEAATAKVEKLLEAA